MKALIEQKNGNKATMYTKLTETGKFSLKTGTVKILMDTAAKIPEINV